MAVDDGMIRKNYLSFSWQKDDYKRSRPAQTPKFFLWQQMWKSASEKLFPIVLHQKESQRKWDNLKNILKPSEIRDYKEI